MCYTNLPVSDAAKVTFHFKETISIESQHQVAVLHFEEDGVQQPDITDIAVQNNIEMTDLSFDTEGFSVYAMVTWSETLDLDGQSYAIVNINENSTKWKPEIISAAMMDQVSNQTLTSSVCSVMQIGSEYYISSNDQFTEWHFEKYEDGYAIWSGTEENKNYINTAWTKTNGDGGLKLSDKPETFYLERDTTGKYAGQMRIRNAKDYAINWCGGENKNKLWFALWKEAQKDRPSCNDYMILATPMQTNMLFFDVNLPTILGSPAPGKEDGWLEKTPSTQTYVTNVDSLNDQPDGYTEGLGAAGKLYQEKYGDDAEHPYTKLYRYHIIDDYQFTNQSNSAHCLYDFDYYKEIRFLGWSYTDSGGTKHIFNANAPITRQDNSTYLITDQTGTAIAIPNGTTFYGEWEQVSSPVEFFICYGGTILDTEGDVKVRNDAYRSLFTSCAAVGTLLYGDLTVGDSELYANEPNKEITAMITTAHDLDFDSKKPQIVLETLTDYAEQDKKVYYNIKNHGANFFMLQDSLLHWIRNDDNMVICLSTGDGNVQINNELATPENYQVRWYVLKDQRDGWHVDGILTATAEEMTITKTFRNLEENQVNEILKNGYQIDLTSKNPKREMISGSLGAPQLSKPITDENGNIIYVYNTYMTLTTTSINGQYDYQSSYDASTKTYTCIWSVRVLNGECYVIKEKNYEYDIGNYNVIASSIIDNQPNTQRFGDTAGRMEDTEEKKFEITGGTTQLVSFSNMYSPAKTATLSILKTNADTGLMMNGISFTLTPIDETGKELPDGTKIQIITNENGYASFTDLKIGTRYQLTEDMTTNYFQPNENTMIVDVTRTESSDIPTITVTETTKDGTVHTYTNSVGNPVLLYSVQNSLSDSTGVITKDFENIPSSEIQKILNNGYQIVVKNGNGTILTTLTQANAVRVSSDYKRLIWYVSGLEDGKTYTVTEEHYQSSSQKYANVTVTAQQSDFIVAPYSIPVTVNGTGENRTASLSMKKSNTHEWVGFINSYSNTYTLKLRKVDSVTAKPLQNAVFALYGKYEEATDPSRIVRYTKPDGSIIILYYIKNAAPTDADGYTTIQGLHFSDTEKSYIYVLQETTVPDGYMTPIDISPKQVLEVTPSQIGNGTYALSMKNTAKTESLTIQKLVSEQLQEKDVSYSIHLKITDTVNFAQAVKKYPFPYVIFNADETIAATGIFEEGTETVISIKAGQTIKIQAVPIGFTYELTEEITDATGTVLYKPCITTADGSVWEHTITGIIQESKAQQSENWITIKNYRADAVPEQKDITVQKQWDDSIQHSDITVLLYQMQTNRNTGTSTTILYDTQTLNDANQWAYTWSNVPRSDKTNDYSYYSGWL